MKKILKAGLTDQTLDIFIQDSSSTTGAGLTGLAYNSASLVCYYRRGATGSATALSLATQTVGGAHSDGGFVEISSTNMPGMYRLDLSDAIVAAGVSTVTLMLKGASNMAPLTIELQLVSIDIDDAVRMGLTALPNAAAEAAGGLYTRGSGAGQIEQPANGQINVNLHRWLTGTPNALQSGRVDSYIGAVADAVLTAAKFAAGAFDAVWSVTTRTLSAFSFSVTVGTNNDKTGYSLSAAAIQAIWDALTSALTTAGSIGKLLVDNINATISSRSSHSAADVWSSGTRTLTAATNITSTGGTTVPQTGDSFARLGAPAGASVSADVAAVKADTAAIKTKTDQLTFTGSDVRATLDGETVTLAAGQIVVKKNVGLNNFPFLMVDVADHVTGKIGATVTAQRSIDGGAFAACANSPAEIGSGAYKINLAASDLNGDTIILKFSATGCDTTFLEVITQP